MESCRRSRPIPCENRCVLLAGICCALALSACVPSGDDEAPLVLVAPRADATISAPPEFKWRADPAFDVFVVVAMLNQPGYGLKTTTQFLSGRNVSSWKMPALWWDSMLKDISEEPSFWMVFAKKHGTPGMVRAGPYAFYPVSGWYQTGGPRGG